VFLVFMPMISQAGSPERKALRGSLRKRNNDPQAPAWDLIGMNKVCQPRQSSPA
jgi:hypothetical protein